MSAYQRPRSWRWWLHVGPNPQPRHDMAYWAPRAVWMRQQVFFLAKFAKQLGEALAPVMQSVTAALNQFVEAFKPVADALQDAFYVDDTPEC